MCVSVALIANDFRDRGLREEVRFGYVARETRRHRPRERAHDAELVLLHHCDVPERPERGPGPCAQDSRCGRQRLVVLDSGHSHHAGYLAHRRYVHDPRGREGVGDGHVRGAVTMRRLGLGVFFLAASLARPARAPRALMICVSTITPVPEQRGRLGDAAPRRGTATGFSGSRR